MTSKRNLGPILAIAGLVVVAGALIAGFIVVGGPGDARDRRLDEMTTGRIMDVANIAQCAFNGTRTAPSSIDEARQVRGWEVQSDKPTLCSLGTTPDQIPVSTGGKPAAAGDVTYEAISATRVRICSVFRKPSGPSEVCNGICLRSTLYPQLEAPRASAGLHCFELDLASTATSAPKDSALPWDEPIDIDALPADLVSKATSDKRAIGDVVNVLRMARCARDIGGQTPVSFEAGLATIRANENSAQKIGCDWASSYFATPYNAPVASYARREGDLISVCVDYATAWPTPLRLNYYGQAAFDWPEYLPALQAPVEAGRHCYVVDLATAPPNAPIEIDVKPSPSAPSRPN